MRAYLIDPEKRGVTEVEYDGNYRSVYTLIGADTFDVVRIDANGDGVYIDDDGLNKDPEFFFEFPGFQPLAGKGLVLGCNAEGDSIAPRTPIEKIRSAVKFSRKLVEGFDQIPDGATIEHPVFGKMGVVGHKVRLKDRKD